MKNYLSFGGGVNSVAMMLYCLDEGWDFEAVFVDHGTDWPETYEYLDMFQEWLDKNGSKPITILIPEVQGYSNLYDYCWGYKMVPSFINRWCTSKFKVRWLLKHYEPPGFELIGFDFGEQKRAKINTRKGLETRWPLIEARMDRDDCKKYIISHGLKLPDKSGCWICPFMKTSRWKDLRSIHPELFCKAERLEKRSVLDRIDRGLKPMYISANIKAPLRVVVEEDQYKLFKRDEYPPCNCML